MFITVLIESSFETQMILSPINIFVANFYNLVSFNISKSNQLSQNVHGLTNRTNGTNGLSIRIKRPFVLFVYDSSGGSDCINFPFVPI